MNLLCVSLWLQQILDLPESVGFGAAHCHEGGLVIVVLALVPGRLLSVVTWDIHGGCKVGIEGQVAIIKASWVRWLSRALSWGIVRSLEHLLECCSEGRLSISIPFKG